MEKNPKNRNLGVKNHKCRICGEEGLFQSYLVKEMMKGTKDEFEYFVCPKCLCLQIAEIPSNLGDYYGNDYYSMSDIKDRNTVFESPVVDSTKILDVGCGNGGWLYEVAYSGHDNLYGCDPFIEKDIHYGDRVFIRKCDITDMDGDGTFDAVRMGDSFEHVTNPGEVLMKAARLIKDTGIIELILPTYPNIAFDLFETHWYQLDAPRHIFLHSIVSLQYLASQCGLEIAKYTYDSNNSQIIRSFFYSKGVSYNEMTNELILEYFDAAEIEKIDEMVEEANMKNMGDHMQVLLIKTGAKQS